MIQVNTMFKLRNPFGLLTKNRPRDRTYDVMKTGFSRVFFF